MKEAQMEASKPSEISTAFPRYRRSHLKSETYRTLVRILSHCCDESQHSGANRAHSASQELKNQDEGTDRMEPESQGKESEHLQSDHTDFRDPKDPLPHKETQVFETFEEVSFQGRDFMMGVEEDAGSSGRQDMVICESESVEAMSMLANGLSKEQKQIDELNQILEGTENLVCDNGLTPLNLELDEKQNGSSEIDLMDYEVEYVEFQQSDINTSGTNGELQVEGEFNQHASEVFDASLIANFLSPTKEQTFVPVIGTPSIRHERLQKEMELVKPSCAAMVSLPTTGEGESEKEEEHSQKVPEAIQISVDQGMNIEALKNIKHGTQDNEMELMNTICTAMGSLPTTGEGEFEKEEEHSQKVPEAIQISVDQGMNIEALKNIKHGTQENEMELMNTISAAMGSLPTTGEGESEKEEEHSQKVPEAIQISVDQGMNIEALKNIKHGTQENEMELINTICAAMGSLPTTGEGESEKEKEHGQKVPEAIQISVDQCMNIEALKNIKHGTQENEMELMNTICAAMGSLPTTGEGESEKEEEHGLKVPEAIEISVDQGTNIEALKNVNHGTEEKEMELVNTVCAAINSLPTTAEDEFKKEEQHSQKATEALNLSMKHEKQQKEMELVKLISAAMGSLPATEEGKLEKMEQHGQKVPEAMDFSVDQGMTSEEAFNLSEHGGDRMPLLDIDILEAKCIMQQEKEQPQKISANDATIFSNNPNEEGDTEEGEISGDLQMDENSFDTSSADSLMLQQRKDEVQKPENVIENIVSPFNMWNAEKEENSKPSSFMVHAPQDACKSGQIEPRTSDKNGFPSGVDMRISREVINYGDLVDHGSVLETGKTYNRDSRIQEAVDLPASLAYNQVQRGFMEEEATEDHQNAPAVKEAGVNCKKKRGPITEEGKAKKKEKKRKQRAEKNRKLGVKRLKLLPVQKPKTISYCRHYVKGRCYEGDKCKYSHDIVPETKSKPCCHFARHSCMKGDDCPFDHQLSKYPCSNFVTKGSCSRGGACMFSHQTSTKQDIPTSSNDSKPGMKPQLLLGNTKLTRPHNISGSSASQQKRLSDSKEIQSHINSGQQLPDNVHKPPTTTPKGISFINFSNSSLPSPSTPKQGMVTPNKESDVKTGTHVNQGALGTAQNLGENPKKKAAVAPKGINFLSFGRGRVSSSKSPVCSFFNRESGINLSKKYNFGLPELSTSSGSKDDCSRVGVGTKQSAPQTAQCSNEILRNNHSVAEGMNLVFPGKASVDHSTNEVKAYTSQISTMTSSLLSVSPFVSGQSSERLASGHQKLVFNSSQRALLSTLSFAAQHESDIKMKCSAGASAIKSEAKKHISNSSS